MNTFFLKVIASDKVFFSGKAEMVNIPTLDGEKSFFWLTMKTSLLQLKWAI